MQDVLELPRTEALVVLTYLERAAMGKLLQDGDGNYLLTLEMFRQLIKRYGYQFTDEIGLTEHGVA